MQCIRQAYSKKKNCCLFISNSNLTGRPVFELTTLLWNDTCFSSSRLLFPPLPTFLRRPQGGGHGGSRTWDPGSYSGKFPICPWVSFLPQVLRSSEGSLVTGSSFCPGSIRELPREFKTLPLPQVPVRKIKLGPGHMHFKLSQVILRNSAEEQLHRPGLLKLCCAHDLSGDLGQRQILTEKLWDPRNCICHKPQVMLVLRGDHTLSGEIPEHENLVIVEPLSVSLTLRKHPLISSPFLPASFTSQVFLRQQQTSFSSSSQKESHAG